MIFFPNFWGENVKKSLKPPARNPWISPWRDPRTQPNGQRSPTASSRKITAGADSFTTSSKAWQVWSKKKPGDVKFTGSYSCCCCCCWFFVVQKWCIVLRFLRVFFVLTCLFFLVGLPNFQWWNLVKLEFHQNLHKDCAAVGVGFDVLCRGQLGISNCVNPMKPTFVGSKETFHVNIPGMWCFSSF